MADKDKKASCALGQYAAYCDCLFEKINELNVLLTALISSYRLLVGSAEEFNRITLAHKGDLEDAIDTADDLGDIIDKIICRLNRLINIYLDLCFQALLCPPIVPPPGTPGAVEAVPGGLETEIVQNLQTGGLEQIIPITEEANETV